MNEGEGQPGFAAMDEHATAIAEDQQHANEPGHALVPVGGEAAHEVDLEHDPNAKGPAAKAFDNVRQLPVHAMHIEDGDDGTETVHYLSRAGEEKAAMLPKGHGVLENFHRAMEAYWLDLEGAAAQFKNEMVEL